MRPGRTIDERKAKQMNTVEQFARSYAVLTRFFATWIPIIDERSRGHDQRHAAYYVWARYCMSMNTIHALLDPHLFPDLAVISRGCLEFNVTLDAIVRDEEMAREYLEFDKHAKARYLKILAKQGDIDRLLKRSKQFEEMFDESPDGFRQTSWCAKRGGITGLMRALERETDVRLYNMLSHFAHGSVSALQILDGRIQDPNELMAKLVDATYRSYLDSTHSFLCFVWEPLETPDGERCKSDFSEVQSIYIVQNA